MSTKLANRVFLRLSHYKEIGETIIYALTYEVVNKYSDQTRQLFFKLYNWKNRILITNVAHRDEIIIALFGVSILKMGSNVTNCPFQKGSPYQILKN